MRPLRWITLFALALLLGAATSVGLALALAWIRTPINSFGGRVVAVAKPAHPFTMGGATITSYWWTFDDRHRFGDRTLCFMSTFASSDFEKPLNVRPTVPAPIERFFNFEYLPNAADRGLDRYSVSVVHAYGWPLPCLWEGETVDGMNAGLTRWPWNGPSYGGIKVGNKPAMGHFLPTLPLWPGLAADAAVFGGAWMGLLLLPAPVRRALRRRRGRCVACKYDLRGLPADTPCPECGTARQIFPMKPLRAPARQ